MSKTLLRALAGEPLWPPPVWLMRQAGRYLPEYRAVRARTSSFVELCTTPELATEVTLQPLRRYGMDGAILFSDILMVPWALGQDLQFIEGEGPALPPIREASDVAALDSGRLGKAIAPILETVRLVRAEVGPAQPWPGRCGPPLPRPVCRPGPHDRRAARRRSSAARIAPAQGPDWPTVRRARRAAGPEPARHSGVQDRSDSARVPLAPP